MIDDFNKMGAIITGSILLGIVLVMLLYRINPFEEKPKVVNKSIFVKNPIKPDSIWIDPDLSTIKIFKGDTTIYINTEYFLNK